MRAVSGPILLAQCCVFVCVCAISVFTKLPYLDNSHFLPSAKFVLLFTPSLPGALPSLLLCQRLGLRVEAPVADVEEEEADGEDDARVLVYDVDVLDAGQGLLHHARPAL